MKIQEDYKEGEEIPIWIDLVDSRKTQVPFKYYDLPVCEPIEPEKQQKKFRKNLGQRLQGYNRKPAPYELHVKQNTSCTPICAVKVNSKALKWLRVLVERQYRIHMSLDSLPVLMRSSELNYAVRGFPGKCIYR